MKAFLILFFSCMLMLTHTSKCDAQIMKDVSPLLSKSTLTNTDTSYVIYQPENSTRNIMVRVTKSSGTPGGIVYIYGSVDATNYDLLDSLEITNVATQYKYFKYTGTLDQLQYYKYKIIFYQTGTAATVPKVYVLKRINN